MKKIPEFVQGTAQEAQVRNLSEAVLDTTTNWDVKLSGVSRRDFMRIAKQYGLAATWTGVAGMGGIFSADALAQTVNTKYDKKFNKKSKHVLKLGTVFQWKHTKIQRTHIWEFAQDVEEVTNGEIRFDAEVTAGSGS